MVGTGTIIWISLASTLINTVSSVDLWGAREQPCFSVTNTVPLDMNWFGSVDTWYFPRVGRYNLYNIATDLLGVPPEDVEEGAMYYDSCVTFKFYPNNTFFSHGYHGRSKEYLSRANKPDLQETFFWPADGHGFSATFYATFTDNKTFAFFPVCTKDGVMTWGVLTPTPSLSEETWEKIARHAISLGLKKEQFTELRYTESCGTPTIPPPGYGGWHY